MRRLLLGTLVLTTLWALPARASEPYQEESQRTYPAAGIERLQIENSRGRVDLSPAVGDQLVLRAIKIVRGHNPRDARELAAATTVEVSRAAGTLVVRVRYPQITEGVGFWVGLGDLERRGVRVHLLLQVPKGVEVTTRVASGDIFSRGVEAPQTLISTSGDIRVEGARGKLDARLTSGDLVARDLDGDASISTVSGDARVTGVRGSATMRSTSGELRVADVGGGLAISSVSGDVSVRGVPAGLSCATTSGDVTVRGAAGTCGISVSSGDVDAELVGPLASGEVSAASGDVTLRLAPEVTCALEVRTGSGSIQVDVPMRVRSVTRHLVSGVVGGGSAPVRVRTSSGEVQILKAGGKP
jgi:hypothetical protein